MRHRVVGLAVPTARWNVAWTCALVKGQRTFEASQLKQAYRDLKGSLLKGHTLEILEVRRIHNLRWVWNRASTAPFIGR